MATSPSAAGVHWGHATVAPADAKSAADAERAPVVKTEKPKVKQKAVPRRHCGALEASTWRGPGLQFCEAGVAGAAARRQQ